MAILKCCAMMSVLLHLDQVERNRRHVTIVATAPLPVIVFDGVCFEIEPLDEIRNTSNYR
jgi:hypothetical protein